MRLYCLCEKKKKTGAGGLACTLTRTPAVTQGPGLQPEAGFGRMPLSPRSSQKELEGGETVSYNDIAPANQLIIVHVGEKRRGREKNITTQHLRKRSER